MSRSLPNSTRIFQPPLNSLIFRCMSAGRKPRPCSTRWVLFLLDAGSHEGQLVVGFAQPINEAGIGLTLVVGALGDFGGNAFHFILEFLVKRRRRSGLPRERWRPHCAPSLAAGNQCGNPLVWRRCLRLGFWTPAMILSKVDLPAPLRPTRPTRSLPPTASEMFSNKVRSPKWTPIWFRLSMGSEGAMKTPTKVGVSRGSFSVADQ